jgi:hypothetical protein
MKICLLIQAKKQVLDTYFKQLVVIIHGKFYGYDPTLVE